MVVKSEDLRRSLTEINHLLRVLRAAGINDEPELEEIDLLKRSRRSIMSLLETRRQQNRQPVVRLQAWHDGRLLAPPFSAGRYAAMAQAARPAPGAPRPYRVS